MKVACPSCRSLFELEGALADGSGAPLCDACRAAGAAPLPPSSPVERARPGAPPVRRSRPKVPAVDFGRRGASGGASAIEQATEPPRESQPGDVLALGPTARDAPEPISLDDLEIVSSPNSGASRAPSVAPPAGARLLDGGFVRSGRPISVLPGDPGPMSKRGDELSLDDLATDVEPVSLRDLGVVLGPAAAPPAWEDAPLKPRAPRNAPPKPPPVHKPAAVAEPRAPAKEPPAPKVKVPSPKPRPAAKETPTFFNVEASAPPPRADVPSAKEEHPSVPPNSGRVDLMSLIAPPSDRPARPAELFNLQGGLFANTAAPAPIVPLSLPEPAPSPAAPPPGAVTAPIDSARSALRGPPAIAPVLPFDRVPPSSRRPPRPVEDDEVSVDVDVPVEAPAPRPILQAAAVGRAPRSNAPGPLVSEHELRPAPRGRGVLAWGAGVVGAAALIALVAARLGDAPPREGAQETALVVTATAAPPETAKAQPVRPAVEPRNEPATTAEPPKAPARATDTPEKRLPSPPATVRAADPPRAADPSRAADPPPARERPAAVEPRPAPPPAAPPPAPAGAEFDRAAAKAALAAAASAASGCKEPDGPSGGARVSITFAPSGRVTSSKIMGPPFQGTQTGGCIARAFRGITVPAFSGDPVTITKEVSVR